MAPVIVFQKPLFPRNAKHRKASTPIDIELTELVCALHVSDACLSAAAQNRGELTDEQSEHLRFCGECTADLESFRLSSDERVPNPWTLAALESPVLVPQQ